MKLTKSEILKNVKSMQEFIENAPDEYFEQEWPQGGDIVYIVCTNGEVVKKTFYLNTLQVGLLKQGRIKRTLKEAEFKRDLETLYAEMEVWSEKHSDEIDWNDEDQSKFSLGFNHGNKQVKLLHTELTHRPNIPYATDDCKNEFLKLFGPQLEEIMKR